MLMSAAAAVSAALVSAPLADFEAAMERLERAVVVHDEATVSSVREALAEARGDGDPRAEYAYAYASWRLASFHERGSKPFKAALEDAEDELERILEERPDDAEAQALYGTVNGFLISGMFSGMRRGPRASSAYENAREADPANPRAALHEGISRLFRPSMFGGGADKAERDLRRALSLFEEEPPDKPWPNGGRAEALAWLGQALYQQGDPDGAREYYNRALELEPDYWFVRDVLIPELETGAPGPSGQAR